DLDAPALAIGGFGQWALGDPVKADPLKRRAGLGEQRLLPPEQEDRVPAQRRLAREQGDDLISAREAAMRAAAARQAGDVFAEEPDAAAIRPELAGDEVEQRRLARAVGADDQAALARRDIEVHIGGDTQAAEGFDQVAQLERAHPALPPPVRSAAAARGPRRRDQAHRHSRTEPGTKPSGMKMTMATKIAPSTRFQRSI